MVLLLSCGVLYIHSRIRVVGKEYRSNKAVGCVQYPHRLDEYLDNLDKARVLYISMLIEGYVSNCSDI